jgi:hypothetical protein
VNWILFTVILIVSIVACAVAKDLAVRKNIHLPKTGLVIAHLLYGLVLVLAYIYL